MNKDYIINLMAELDFPEEAISSLTGALQEIEKTCQTEFDGAVEFYYENNFDFKMTSVLLDEIAVLANTHRHTVDMLFLLAASETLRSAFEDLDRSDSLFLDTMSDLRFKLYECHEVYGIWGNFVSFWYNIFFSCDIVKLGRLEYENTTYDRDIPYEKCGLEITKGYPVKSIHIPSHDGPLTDEIRLKSYKKAYEFFADELDGKPIVFVCHSWLLHDSTAKILKPGSNTIKFFNDFDIIDSQDSDKFMDLWRVFGNFEGSDYSRLPENSSMQRAYKNWLTGGKKTGYGYGIIIFDGEKIIN